MSGDASFDDKSFLFIDAYLIEVENALVTAGAPRADRMQVLQNLETQIDEMLRPHPLPFSEETVRAVLDKLEPPSHFAAMYSNGGKRTESAATISSAPQRSFRLARPDWSIVAAVCAGILALGVPFAMIAAASGPNDFWIILTILSCFVGIVFTPIALWMAYGQLRSDPTAAGRIRVLNSTVVYGTIAPILVVLLAAEATNGAAPILFGFAAFFYAQYHLVRRAWKYLCDALPTPTSPPRTNSVGRGAPPSAHQATPMPAM